MSWAGMVSKKRGIYLTKKYATYRYMANDMQFFLTSPFIIFALWSSRNQPWKRNIGLALLGILLVIFTAIPTVIGVVEDYPFSPMLMNGADPNSMGDYMYNFYVVPWCRSELPPCLQRPQFF